MGLSELFNWRQLLATAGHEAVETAKTGDCAELVLCALIAMDTISKE